MLSNLGSGLAFRGFTPNRGMHVAVIAGNIMEWAVIAEMCYAFNHVLIGIHDTFSAASKIAILTRDPAPNIDVRFHLLKCYSGDNKQIQIYSRLSLIRTRIRRNLYYYNSIVMCLFVCLFVRIVSSDGGIGTAFIIEI